MTVYDRTSLSALVSSRLANNTSSQISPEDVRQTQQDAVDSAVFPQDARPESLIAMPRLKVLTDGANIDWNVAQGITASVVLAGNRTFNAPTNLEAGMKLRLMVRQDATGSRTLTWNAAFVWAGGSAPTLTTTAHRVDSFDFTVVHDGSGYKLIEAARILNLNIGTSGGGMIEP